MSASTEAQLVEQIEREARHNEAWEDDPPPTEPATASAPLGAQITVRLEPAVMERLRAVADREQLPFSRLVRRWIEERLEVELAGAHALSEAAELLDRASMLLHARPPGSTTPSRDHSAGKVPPRP